MKKKDIDAFIEERDKLNELVMKYSGRNIKRFFNIDTQIYTEGALPKKMKELMGLVGSLVLRCDDCVKYHLVQCSQEKVTDAELEESLAIALIIGGSITIPHLRRAFRSWEELK